MTTSIIGEAQKPYMVKRKKNKEQIKENHKSAVKNKYVCSLKHQRQTDGQNNV